ncbi:helix-turn-helix domain-containing protein [Actinoplanes sp. NPDC051470]|uniref:TetR/AcrR family transcriptional regulator n=1 Tax=unclassified Actinoplanes TaxID=2626549 RepID=UPI0034240664
MVRVSTRDEILRVAGDQFARVGFKGTSLQDIAVEVGCSKAALLYHFAGKEQILLALVSTAETALADLLADLDDRDDETAQALAIERFVDLVLHYRREAALVYEVVPQFHSEPAFYGVLQHADKLCAAVTARSGDPAEIIAAQTVMHGIVNVAIDDKWDAAELRPALLRVARRALITTPHHDKD